MRYIPVSIVIGFTNGIAVLIALSQLRDLLGLQIAKLPADFFAQLARALARTSTPSTRTRSRIGIAASSGLVRMAAPVRQARRRCPERDASRARTLRAVVAHPGAVVALVSLTLVVALLDLPVETIGTRFGGIPQTPARRLRCPPFAGTSAQAAAVLRR